MKWKGGWRPGRGEEEEKVERKTQQNRQCLDGLSRVIETAFGAKCEGNVPSGSKRESSDVVFWAGEGVESTGKGSCGDNCSDVLIL